MHVRNWLFELGAPIYHWLTRQRAWREHCAEMARRFPPGRAPRVADLGGGPGISALGFLDVRPDARVVDVDLSLPMLRHARRAIASENAPISVVNADAGRLPFRDATFAVATGHSFLYLLPDRPRVLAEIVRVLEPGGRLVVLEPARQAPWHRGVLFRGPARFRISMALWRMASARYGRFDREELSRLLGAAGFRDIDVQPTLGGMGWLTTATAPAPSRTPAPAPA